jgi:hypothetical protein
MVDRSVYQEFERLNKVDIDHPHVSRAVHDRPHGVRQAFAGLYSN